MADILDEPTEFENMCSTEALFQPQLTLEEQCAMASEHCESASMFNFYKLYFCTLNTSSLAFYPVGVSLQTLTQTWLQLHHASPEPNILAPFFTDFCALYRVLPSEFHS